MKLTISADGNDRGQHGLAAMSIKGRELDQDYTLDLPFRDVYRRFGTPQPVMLDFAVIASLCYAIDKIVPRWTAEDNWTRRLEVDFPVSDATAWEPARDALARALSFLSGDRWTISFRTSRTPLFVAPERVRMISPERSVFDAACLFSGGLDSLAGAIELLEMGKSVLLVGHFDSAGPRTQQGNLYSELQKLYGDRVELRQTRASQRPRASAERTLRSRSIAFIGLGLLAASAAGEEVPLYTCENGLIALNPPLTPSRAGSCSTRTMHPYYLDQLREALVRVGIRNEIVNPYAFKTKGECIRDCGNVPLLKKVMTMSASCSHGARRQFWERKTACENCGYCVPCLYRRAALNASGLDRGADYGIDVFRKAEFDVDGASSTTYDMQALLSFINRLRTPEKIALEITRNSSLREVPSYVDMVGRGLEELRSWLRAKGTRAINKRAGL